MAGDPLLNGERRRMVALRKEKVEKDFEIKGERNVKANIDLQRYYIKGNERYNKR